jgi:hypothetical protein
MEENVRRRRESARGVRKFAIRPNSQGEMRHDSSIRVYERPSTVPGPSPKVTGDVITVQDGRISSLYSFIDSLPTE